VPVHTPHIDLDVAPRLCMADTKIHMNPST
jgi:hypothetical protein